MKDDRDFSRQSFLGPHSEDLLRHLRVAIAGLGGGGSHIAQQLAHVGVGNFRLMDPDDIEASNLNRLVGATKADIDEGTAKVEIARRTIHGIRPWADVKISKTVWQDADHLIRDAHVLIGCVDGYLRRDDLESAARRFGIPYIDVGMDVAEIAAQHFAVAGQVIVTLPGKPCMRCLGFLTTERLAREENRYGDAGINPQVVWTNGMLASLAVGALMKLVTPWASGNEEFTWLELDGNEQTVATSQQPNYFPREAECPHRTRLDEMGDPFFNLQHFRASLATPETR